MGTGTDFGTLALIVAIGLAGPLLAALPRVGPPIVVGEILAGVALGRSGADVVPVDDPALDLLSQVGFALLMLVVGTHLPIRDARLLTALRRGLGLLAASGALAVGLGVVLAPVVGLRHPLVLAVLLATSSAAVALPVLQALHSDHDLLLVATAWIAVADVATVLAIPLVVRKGSVVEVLVGSAAVLAVTAALYAVARAVDDRRSLHRLRHRSKKQHWALDLRVSLLVLFCLSAIATRLHTSVLVAGFAAGGLIAPRCSS